MKLLLVVLTLLTGCVHTQEDLLPVRVDAFSTSDFKAGEPICFYSNEITPAGRSQIDSAKINKMIIDNCTYAARLYGLTVLPAGDNCNGVMIEWETARGIVSVSAPTTFCSKGFNGIPLCSTTQSQSVEFSKSILISFFNDAGEQPNHEIKATTATEHEGMHESTAIGLCRAAFRSYPENVRNKSFSASTDFNDYYSAVDQPAH